MVDGLGYNTRRTILCSNGWLVRDGIHHIIGGTDLGVWEPKEEGDKPSFSHSLATARPIPKSGDRRRDMQAMPSVVPWQVGAPGRSQNPRMRSPGVDRYAKVRLTRDARTFASFFSDRSLRMVRS